VGKYDDTHPNWVYSGAWTHFSGAFPFYNNTDSYSGVTGNTASFTFSGTQFILTYTMNTVRGNMEVYVDGNKVATINANGSQTFQLLYISPALSNGTHQVTVRNAGGGGGYIDVDAIQILNTPVPSVGKYDDSHANWVYTGSWTHFTGAFPFYNNTDSYSGVTGEMASFTFSGRQFILSYTMNAVRGNLEIYVDGSKVATLNANGPQTFQLLYISPMLSNGTHVMQVRNGGGGGGYIDVDALQILASAPPGVGKYDDSHPNWVYNGSWTHFTGAFPFYNNTDSYSGVTGETASFTFTGTQFLLTYTMNLVRGNMEIYVDGSKVATLNAYGPQTFQVLYTSAVFLNGTHVVQVRNGGGGGGYIDVDAIQILNTPVPGAGTYDDTHANWVYTGSWTHFSGAFPFYNNTDSYSGITGETASFTFAGTQFVLRYTRNTVRGNMEIYVDGNKIATVNAYGPQTFQVLYTSPVLSNGPHQVRIRNAGGGPGYIDVDAITIN
jgi:Tfp pilus assembly protein FimT